MVGFAVGVESWPPLIEGGWTKVAVDSYLWGVGGLEGGVKGYGEMGLILFGAGKESVYERLEGI